jgi:hypothetical protein
MKVVKNATAITVKALKPDNPKDRNKNKGKTKVNHS